MKASNSEVEADSRANPGDTLRQARERNSWPLAEVAFKLNLTNEFLGNLESGAFEKLPGHTFARGYIRAYAKLLGIDQAVLVQEFDQFTGTDSKGSDVHSLGSIENPSRGSHTILRIVSLLLLIAVIVGGFFWWQDQSQHIKSLTSKSIKHLEFKIADGTTTTHHLDKPKDQAVPKAQLAIDSPAKTIIAHASQASPGTSPPTNPTLLTGDGHIQINFVADCWTQVNDRNGKVLFSGLNRKGDTLDQVGMTPLEITLGFARGARVIYNGQPIGVAPFTSGETARLKLGQ